MKTIKILILLCGLFTSIYTHAADAEGKFTVKGAGKHSCESFSASYKNRTTDYYLYGGWVEGYISAYNQFQPDNFDITPWETTELLLSLLKKHCDTNPEIKFLSAVNSLIKTLFPIRLNQSDNLVKIQVGSFEGYYYQSIILRAKQRLQALNYIKGELKAEYTETDAIAFEKYQKDIGLKPTGIPDQKTLTSLFLKPKK